MMNRKGFTLIELAIVLIIIGVITASVLAGRELIRAGEIASIAAQMQRYQSAYYKYKEKYGAMPGDHDNAYDYWGTDCHAVQGTCNGGGNRLLNLGEAFMFLRHLYLAGFIDEDLTGLSSTPGVIGTNLPTTAIDGVTLWPYTWSKMDYFIEGSAGASYDGLRALILNVGLVTTNYWNSSNAFTPEEAKKIDTKIDDGKPGTGVVIAAEMGTTSGTGCADNSTDTLEAVRVSDYRVGTDSIICKIGIILEEPV